MNNKKTKEKDATIINDSTVTDCQLKTPKHNLGKDFLECDKTEL